MLNKVILQGRCGKDPEKRTTPSGVPVTSVSLAVDRDFNKDGEKKTDWIDVVAWRGTANFLADHFHAGRICGGRGTGIHFPHPGSLGKRKGYRFHRYGGWRRNGYGFQSGDR